MKVLIWVGCFFVASMLNALLGYITGIKAGYLVFYFVVVFVAKKLCQKWEEHKSPKETMKKVNEPVNTLDLEVDVSQENKICFCRKCGEKLIDNSQFCRKCGTAVVKE